MNLTERDVRLSSHWRELAVGIKGLSRFGRPDGVKMSVVALGGSYFVTSLRAVGVEGRIVGSAKEAEEALELLVGEGECKVVIVPESLSPGLDRKRDELSRRGVVYPVFAVVPDVEGRTLEKTNRLYRLVSQAVGAKLKLGEG